MPFRWIKRISGIDLLDIRCITWTPVVMEVHWIWYTTNMFFSKSLGGPEFFLYIICWANFKAEYLKYLFDFNFSSNVSISHCSVTSISKHMSVGCLVRLVGYNLLNRQWSNSPILLQEPLFTYYFYDVFMPHISENPEGIDRLPPQLQQNWKIKVFQKYRAVMKLIICSVIAEA